jgi:DNA-binding FadR family transcriptional regulator
MNRFKPIRQIRISEVVADQLKESILLGQFKDGDRLPSERELADAFQVSRVAIREALRTLENAGFISIRQGATGGAFVTDLTFQQLSNAFLDLFLAEKISIPELYQVRLLFEPEVARLAATKVTTGYAKRLKEALEAEGQPIKSLREDAEIKASVHLILAEMGGNRLFEALIRSLIVLTRKVILAVEPEVDRMHPAGMHRPIVEAVLAKNPNQAAQAMKKHTMEFGKTLMEMEKTFRLKKSPILL